MTDVNKTFNGVRVLENFCLEASATESIALMGPSGSGKSTILAILSGFLKPDSGTIHLPENTHLSWIFQNTPMLMHRTALDNVALGALSIGKDPKQAQELATKAMRKLKINQLSNSKARKLSGGERQRVAVAREIVSSADILLADEPTASLDAQSRERVCDALELARQSGTTVIIATHDAYVASRCSRPIDLSQRAEKP